MLVEFGIIFLTLILTHFLLRKLVRRLILAQSFPGPPALPFIGNAHLFLGKPPEQYILTFQEIVKKYGNIIRVWLGPELNLLVSDPSFIETVLGTNLLMEKAGEYQVLDPWLKEGLLVSSGEKWFKRRKIITPAFHFKILEQFLEIFDAQSSSLVRILNDLKDKDNVVLHEYVGMCALDILCGPPAIFILGNVQVAKRWQPEDLVQLLYDISGKYGATFRIWIGTELNIFTSDCKFIESVLNSNGLITKAHEYDYLRPWIRDGLLLSSGKKWHDRRKIITPAFHFKILEEYVRILNIQTNELVLSLQRSLDREGFEDKENIDLVEFIALCALDIICGRKWFGRRKTITPAFHFRILEQFVDVFDTQSNILVKILSKYSPEDEVELYPYITLCALDVICETAMGVSCKAQVNSDSKYVQAVKTISMVLHKRMFDVQYRLDFLFRLTNLARIQNQALKIIHDFSSDVIVARRNELLRAQQDKSTVEIADENDNSIGAKKKMAFLDILLQSNVDGKPLSNMDIQEEVDTFMFEGHDTTTSAITFCLYNLALYPEAQQKCFDEICDVIGKDKDKAITYTDLNNLNYMELVAKETLRLFPSVPLLGRKVTKECTINGKRIPAGTNIGISPLVLGRMEEIFPQSDKFIPERFDSSMVTGGDKMNPYCYIPFSAGPRNCIGQKFAMLEIKSVVSKILRHFTVEMAPDQDEPLLVAELILKSKNALKFKLKPRIYT